MGVYFWLSSSCQPANLILEPAEKLLRVRFLQRATCSVICLRLGQFLLEIDVDVVGCGLLIRVEPFPFEQRADSVQERWIAHHPGKDLPKFREKIFWTCEAFPTKGLVLLAQMIDCRGGLG